MNLLLVLIDEIGMNGLGYFLFVVFDVLMVLVHFVDMFQLLFFELEDSVFFVESLDICALKLLSRLWKEYTD